MKVAALIAASGQGQRMGGEVKKQYLTLGGIPIIARVLEVFVKHQAVSQIVVIVPEGEIGPVRKVVKSFWPLDKICFVEGGKRRQDSVWLGLQAVSPDVEMVCVHDGVRPFISIKIFEDVLEAAAKFGAAVPVIPVTDTLKKVFADGLINRTISRESVYRVQTPQIFRYALIAEAYQKASLLGVEATDDAYLLELLGETVYTVPGSPSNIKITHPIDLVFAEALLKRGW